MSEWVYFDMDTFSLSLNLSSLIVEKRSDNSRKFCSLSLATIEEPSVRVAWQCTFPELVLGKVHEVNNEVSTVAEVEMLHCQEAFPEVHFVPDDVHHRVVGPSVHFSHRFADQV